MPVPEAPPVDHLFYRGELDSAIRTILRTDATIRSERPLGGGSVADVRLLELSSGGRVVAKRGDEEDPDASATGDGPLVAEARGLCALAAGGEGEGTRVPEVLGIVTAGGRSTLITEYIDGGRRAARFASRLGHSLAHLHRGVRSRGVGFARDNFIGSTPQRNAPSLGWFEFFGERRLLDQVERAARSGRLDGEDARRAQRVVARLAGLIPDLDDGRASLLHGDLWNGNVITSADGEPVLIDPAVYYGHRETDLAMTELFGGFGEAFFEAYSEVWPLEPGYSERRDIYNLYHLLNHLNMFGSSYHGSCVAILRRFGR